MSSEGTTTAPSAESLKKMRARYWRGDQPVIGGSDFCSIMGIAPPEYNSSSELAEIMLGQREPKPETYYMKRGKALEPVLREWYEEKTGWATREGGWQLETGRTPPWLRVSPDAFVDSPEGLRLLEMKVTGSASNWGEEGSDQIPPWHLPQVMVYGWAYGVEWVDVVAEISGVPRLFSVRVDDDYVQEMILPWGERFVAHLVRGEMPPPVERRDLSAMYARTEVPLEADDAALIDLRDQAELHNSVKVLEVKREAAIFRLVNDLRDKKADHIVKDGVVLATYYADKNGRPRFRPASDLLFTLRERGW